MSEIVLDDCLLKDQTAEHLRMVRKLLIMPFSGQIDGECSSGLGWETLKPGSYEIPELVGSPPPPRL